MKDKPSNPKNKYAKPLKFNLGSIFSDKPIVKNGYIIALLVFIGLVVAFNFADSYDKSTGNEVTGMASSNSPLSNSFGKITDLLNVFSNFIFGDILEGTVLGAFLLHNVIIIRLMIFIVLFTIISLFKLPKTIPVIIALLTAVFVPQEVIESIFSAGGLFSGGLGLVIWGAVIFLPLFGLFKWLKHTQSKLTSIFLGFMFLGWLFVINAVNSNVYVTPYFTDLWDLLIGFGNLSCLFGAGWGFLKGITTGTGSLSLDYKNVGDFIRGGGIKGDWERTKGDFKGLWGRGGGGGDQREASVKLGKMSVYYKKAMRNPKIGDEGRQSIIGKFIQQAGKLGIGKDQAKKILWKK